MINNEFDKKEKFRVTYTLEENRKKPKVVELEMSMNDLLTFVCDLFRRRDLINYSVERIESEIKK